MIAWSCCSFDGGCCSFAFAGGGKFTSVGFTTADQQTWSGLFIQTAAGAKKFLKTLFLSPFGAENFFK